MIRVIIFDLGKVLLDFNNHLIAERLEGLSGRPHEEIFNFIFRTPLETRFDRGEITAEEFFARVKKQLCLTMRFEDFIPVWCDIFTPVTGMRELVARLSGRYRLGILSNTNSLHFDYVSQRYPVVREIPDHHLSYALHLQKPEEAMYRRVLGFYGCSPDEMAYIDDIEAYVQGARKIGIHAFRFTGIDRLEKDFQAIGIETKIAPTLNS